MSKVIHGPELRKSTKLKRKIGHADEELSEAKEKLARMDIEVDEETEETEATEETGATEER